MLPASSAWQAVMHTTVAKLLDEDDSATDAPPQKRAKSTAGENANHNSSMVSSKGKEKEVDTSTGAKQMEVGAPSYSPDKENKKDSDEKRKRKKEQQDLRTRKIRIFPTPAQQLLQWMGVARWTYNQCVTWLLNES